MKQFLSETFSEIGSSFSELTTQAKVVLITTLVTIVVLWSAIF